MQVEPRTGSGSSNSQRSFRALASTLLVGLSAASEEVHSSGTVPGSTFWPHDPALFHHGDTKR